MKSIGIYANHHKYNYFLHYVNQKYTSFRIFLLFINRVPSNISELGLPSLNSCANVSISFKSREKLAEIIIDFPFFVSLHFLLIHINHFTDFFRVFL